MAQRILDFANPAEYSFPASLIEIVGGNAQLKNLIPATASFYADYEVNIDGVWGDGILTGVPTGGASVVDGKLDLAHNDLRYVGYDAVLNANSQQTGCIRFKFIPNYNGSNLVEQILFVICKNAGSGDNLIFIRQRAGTTAGGYLVLHMHDHTGALIKEVLLGYWAAIQGQEYEFELNYDLTNGQTRFFIDGTQYGSTITETGVRDNNINLLRIGSYFAPSPTHVSNFSIADFVYFSTVQHISDYIPDWSGIPHTPYSLNSPQIKAVSTLFVDGVEALEHIIIVSGLDKIQYTVEVNSIQYWWNGVEWSISSNYAHTNTLVELNDNLINLDLVFGRDFRIVSHLYSENGFTTPALNNQILTYAMRGPDPTKPFECLVYGYLYNLFNQPSIGKKLEAVLTEVGSYDSKITISGLRKEVITDDKGYWEMLIPTTIDMQTGIGVQFTIRKIVDISGKTENKVYEAKIIPKQTEVNFEELIDV